MKRTWLLIVVNSLLLIAVFSPVVHAQSSRIVCTSNCLGQVLWGNGTQFPIYGAQTNMRIDNPGVGADGDWLRYITIYQDASQGYGAIEAGIEKVGSNNGYFYCSGAYSLNLFIYTVKPDGTAQPVFCRTVPSGDYNAQATFQISRLSDGNYDVFMDFKNEDGPCHTGCSIYNISAPNYDFIWLQEALRNQTIPDNQHFVYGGAWGYNEYQDSNLNWHYQPQENCSGTGSGGCAEESYFTPRFYWHIKPQNSATGGEIYSCEYDPYPANCTYGS